MSSSNCERNTNPNPPISTTPNQNREHSLGGIKFFTGTPLPSQDQTLTAFRSVTVSQLRDDMKVWRPEETLEAGLSFFGRNKVDVIGDPQSGKGTILFGLSEVCNIQGWGYMFIDGHHQETTWQEVVRKIEEAQERNIPIFYDSFDYLFARSRSGIREVSLNFLREKTPRVVEAIASCSTPVAITRHDENWARTFLDLDFRQTFADSLATFPTYHIPHHFQSLESIAGFLRYFGTPEEGISFILSMPKNPWVINTLTKEYGDKSKVEEVFEASLNFPVLKELAKPIYRRDEVQPLLDNLARGNQNIDHLLELAQIILESEHKRVHLTTLRKTK